MKNIINVARYHLIDPLRSLASPWIVLTFVFVVNLIITRVQGGPNPTKALVAIYAVFAILGIVSIVRSLPFGLALGLSRRTFYAGTAQLAIALAGLDGIILAALEEVERATGGWGVDMHFFQVGYIFVGAWYLTWLTSFVCLAFAFAYGMCTGTIYRRFDTAGVAAFVLAQGILVLIATRLHSVSHFFTHLSVTGLTGILGALTVLLLATGYAVVRRLSV